MLIVDPGSQDLTGYVVRNAGIGDVQTISSFNRSMAQETEARTLDQATIHEGVLTMVQDEGLGFYLIAETREGDPAGCLGVTFEWSDWRNGLFWWIQSVFVALPHRNRGVFSNMYRTVKDRASKTPKVCGLRLYVEKENVTAQKTYSSLGMARTHYYLLEEEF